MNKPPYNTKEETFKKVFIRSEANLPKETGRYLSYHRVLGAQYYHYDNEAGDASYWLRYIDWYLQPISPIPMTKDNLKSIPSEKWLYMLQSIYDWVMSENLFIPHEYMGMFKELILSELSLSPERKMTDEMIEKEAEKEIDPGVIADFHHGSNMTALRRRMWSYGAKFARDFYESQPSTKE